VQLEEALEIEYLDRAGVRTRLKAANLPSPWHLLAGLARWPALSWRDRIAAFDSARRSRAPHDGTRAGCRSTGPATSRSSGWLERHGQTPRLIEMLWDPLAVAALNQPPAVAAAEPFVRVLAQMFGGSRRDAAIGLPRVPLDALYALPAAEWLRAAAARSAPRRAPASCATTIACRTSTCAASASRRRSSSRRAVARARGHARAGAPVDARHRGAAAATESSPIVTVNLWLDRAVTDVPFVGLPGRTMQWVFDKRQAFGTHASHLSLVSSGAEAIVARANADLIDLALSEVREGLPLAREARVVRATVVREKRATFSLAPGQPPRPRRSRQ
jgi:hydroxysqualene dehydroxylase